MCRLAGVSRAGYYRYWQRSAPRQEETGLRDVIQRLALANRHYGYRRIGALLGREGWQANHKRVLRLMGEDNLLCLRNRPFVPRTTDSKHSWRVVPNLARGMGDCQEFCAVGRFHQLKNRSPKMTANCVFASTHSPGARFHCSAALLRTRYNSFIAASPGKCPRERTARRSFELRASIAFVV